MYSAIASNKRNTIIFMVVFLVLIAGLAYVFAQFYQSLSIFWWTLAVSLIYVLIQYFVADKLALAMNGAQEITKNDNPRLYRMVENLAIATGLPMPKVYIIDDQAPNAFATGRDPQHASVAATTGLLDIMDDNQLEGVIAHELGHVQNYDIRVMMIVFGLVSVIGLITDLFFRMMWFTNSDNRPSNPVIMVVAIAAIVLAPIVALLVQLAVSRQREYLADATGAHTTRYPEGLASALAKLEQHSTVLKRQNSSTAHLFFANPLKGKGIANLFSTHPPISERIARLQHIGTEM
ncbi:protease [Candidatus Saccharibacteria bacterium]|nr:MAG: protease [Candidatus Saccharibacteria bacterium]